MNKLGFLYLLAILPLSLASQSTFTGNVYENANCSADATRKFLPGATISADGARSAATSRQDGSFSLEFPAKQPNESVTITISKPGFQTVRQTVKTCKQCNTPNIFILCQKTGTSSASLPTVSKKIIEENGKLAQNETKLGQTAKDSEEYKKLQKEKEQIQNELKATQEEFARLSAQATEKDWKNMAYELQNMLSDVNIEVNPEKKSSGLSDSFYKTLDSLWVSIETAGADSIGKDPEIKRKSEIRKYESKALLYTIDNQFEKSVQCYQKLMQLDPKNLEYLYSYVIHLSILNRSEEAIAQLEKGLNANPGQSLLHLKSYNFLAALYLEANQSEKVKSVLDKNIQMYMALSKDTAQYAEKQVLGARVHELYAIFYFTLNEFNNCLQEYEASKAIFVQLNKKENNRYKDKIADVDTKLASVYTSIKSYNNAFNLYQESLSIYEDLLKNGNQSYEFDKFDVILELANLYFTRNDFKEAEKQYKVLEGVFMKLAVNDPEQYQEQYAKTLFAAGKMQHEQKQYGLAESKYNQALAIYQKLHKEGKSNHNSQIASTLNARGKSLYMQKKMTQCKADYDAALVINSGLAKKAPETYEPFLADSYSLLGSYYQSVEKMDSAFFYLDKALKISQKFDAKEKRAYRLPLIQHKQSMASYYFDKKESKLAIKEMEEAYTMAQELVKIDSVVFLPDYATTVLTLGLVYLDKDENEVAIRKCKEALEIFQRLSKKQPDAYELQEANIQYALGLLYAEKDDDKQALDYFEKASALCVKLMPKNTSAYTPLLAQIYLAKSNISQKNEKYAEELKYLDEAERLFKVVLSNTNLDEYRNQLGNIKIRMVQICIKTKAFDRAEKDASEARQIFSDLSTSDPGNVNGHLANLATIENISGQLNRARGRFSVALDDYRRAQKYYKKLRLVSPPDFHVAECKTGIEIGETQHEMGQDQLANLQYQSIIDSIKAVLQKKPAYEPNYLSVLANIYEKLGDINFASPGDDALGYYMKALEHYKKAEVANKVSYADNIAVISLNTGKVYLNKKRITEALSTLEQAIQYIQNDPKSTNFYLVMIEGHNTLAGHYFFNKSYDEALPHYRKCLEFESHLIDVMDAFEILELKYNTGISYIRTEEPQNQEPGKTLLRNVRVSGKQQKWTPEQQIKVNSMQDIMCKNHDVCD